MYGWIFEVSDIAISVRPWNAFENAITAGRPVAARAILTAFSIASAPELKNAALTGPEIGTSAPRRSASSTYDSYGTIVKSVCRNRSTCACTRAETASFECPTVRQPMPPAKSRNVLPSTSVSVAPEARSTKIGTTRVLARATDASFRAIHSRETGPGISVRIWIDRSTVSLLLQARERPCAVRPSPGTARTLLRTRYQPPTAPGSAPAIILPMVLSDRSILEEVAAGRIGLDPFEPALVQPSSVDVRCDNRFRVFHPGRYPFIDVRVPMPDLTELVEIDGDRAFILHPGEFVLGATFEVLRLPDDLVARLDGKSSLGRLGLQVHSTAGLADPGFEGQITLELSNVASLPIAIYPGMRIAQLVFERLTTPADRPYGAGGLGSKYQGQRGPTASEYWRNFSVGEK